MLRYTRLPKIMWRAIRSLVLGMFFTALFLGAISVYVFHDVDKDRIGHWNQAFAEFSIEAVLFSLVVGGLAWLLALLGRKLLKLGGYSPAARMGLYLGIAVAVLQYPFEFAARKLVPGRADSALSLYIVLAVLICTVGLLHDTFKQRKLQEEGEPASPRN